MNPAVFSGAFQPDLLQNTLISRRESGKWLFTNLCWDLQFPKSTMHFATQRKQMSLIKASRFGSHTQCLLSDHAGSSKKAWSWTVDVKWHFALSIRSYCRPRQATAPTCLVWSMLAQQGWTGGSLSSTWRCQELVRGPSACKVRICRNGSVNVLWPYPFSCISFGSKLSVTSKCSLKSAPRRILVKNSWLWTTLICLTVSAEHERVPSKSKHKNTDILATLK